MLQMLISQCDGFARFVAAACGNTAIPSVIAVAVAFLVTRFKVWNSASRYWAWWLTLIFVVLLPVAMVLFRPAARASEGASVPIRQIQARDAESTGIEAPPRAKSVAAADAGTLSSRTLLASTAAILFLLYCGAFLVQLSRLVLGLFASIRLKRRAEISVDATMNAQFAAFIRALAVRRRVSFVISDGVSAPVAIGYRRPCILLPRKLVGQLDAYEMEQVMAHELAHISRYDDWLIGIQKLIEAVFVFHPLVHLISRRIDLDREMACDDQVISSYQPRAYAACLTKIAELVEFGAATTLMVPLLARKSHLASRVEMVLDRTRAHLPMISIRRLVAFAIFGIFAACISLRAPALFALPALSYGNAGFLAELAAMATQPAAPAQTGAPLEHPAGTSGAIDSIAVTSQNGASITFEQNGNERTGHSPFPRGTIVFERNGNSYIIRDHSTVVAAQELLRPQEELSRQQEALSSQQEKLSEMQEKLSEQQEALSNRSLDAATVSDFEKQLRNLEEKIRSIDVEKSLKTATTAQERVAELQSLLADMQSRMGDEQGKTGEEQSKLGEQQGRLGEEQGHLGDQQGKLGEQQAREAKRAEQKLKDLIRNAEAKGLAKSLE